MRLSRDDPRETKEDLCEVLYGNNGNIKSNYTREKSISDIKKKLDMLYKTKFILEAQNASTLETDNIINKHLNRLATMGCYNRKKRIKKSLKSRGRLRRYINRG